MQVSSRKLRTIPGQQLSWKQVLLSYAGRDMKSIKQPVWTRKQTSLQRLQKEMQPRSPLNSNVVGPRETEPVGLNDVQKHEIINVCCFSS